MSGVNSLFAQMATKSKLFRQQPVPERQPTTTPMSRSRSTERNCTRGVVRPLADTQGGFQRAGTTTQQRALSTQLILPADQRQELLNQIIPDIIVDERYCPRTLRGRAGDLEWAFNCGPRVGESRTEGCVVLWTRRKGK
jgi:hypothetical protein